MSDYLPDTDWIFPKYMLRNTTHEHVVILLKAMTIEGVTVVVHMSHVMEPHKIPVPSS